MRKARWAKVLVLPVLILAMLAAACGGDDDDDGATEAEEVGPGVVSDRTADATNVVVKLREFAVLLGQPWVADG
jgi:hypothetical protein